MVFKLSEKPVGKDSSNPAYITVTREFLQVSMHAHQGKSDGAGRMKILCSSQCFVEKGRSHREMPGMLKKSHRLAKAPERSAMCVNRKDGERKELG